MTKKNKKLELAHKESKEKKTTCRRLESSENKMQSYI